MSHVLVVEDNPATMKLVRATLTAEDLVVLEARDAAEAVALARGERRPDLVLLDLFLPDRDGFALLPDLRAACPDAPIVAMSGFFSRAEDARTGDAGFDDVLVKPVEPSRLASVVRTWLAPRRAEVRAARRRRVLLVDDDPIQRKYAAARLRALGFDVEVAADGAEALERLRLEPFAAVVSDVLMPRLDGFGLCRAIRGDPGLAHLVVVLATSSYVEEEDRSFAAQVGADAYVVRTPGLESLAETLADALAGALGGRRAASVTSAVTTLEREYTTRVVRQLERQAALNAALAQRCTVQAAALSILGGVAEALASEQDVRAGLVEVLGRCLDAGGFASGAVYLLSPDERRVSDVVHIGRHPSAVEVEAMLGPGGTLRPAVERLEPVDLPPEEADDPGAAGPGVVVPIAHGREPLGVLLLRWHDEPAERDGWMTFARALGLQLGQAVALARAFEKVTAGAARQREMERALRASQDQLRQAQKMEAIGRLAGGVAHDFNNLLTAMIGFSELALQRLDPGGPGRREVEEVRKAADRAARLTHQLLTFSRHRVTSAEVLDPNAVLSDLERLLVRVIGEDVDLRLSLDPGVGFVRLDRTQLEQVVMNLVVNARDAMPNGGRLDVTTRAEDREGNPGRWVAIRVADSGRGIAPEARDHLFEPFFTTKEPGKGTGLGLSTVWGIVENAGGRVEVQSELGQGATFTVLLPRVEQPAGTPPTTTRRARPVAGSAAATVLVVDDDPAVREIVCAALRLQAYRLLAASTGEEALAVSRGAGQVDLVVTDVVMSGMSGLDLARRLRAERPDLRVLFMSGYADGRLPESEDVPGALLVRKPFTPRELLDRVEELLGER